MSLGRRKKQADIKRECSVNADTKVWAVVFIFRFRAPNSDRFGLAQANFEADFSQLTNFGNFKQKPSNYGLIGTKSCPNSAIFQSDSAKIFL